MYCDMIVHGCLEDTVIELLLFFSCAFYCFYVIDFDSFICFLAQIVRRPSFVCVSVRVQVNFLAQIASTTTKIARSRPNLHRMVSRSARIQVVLKVKVKVKGHVIRALLGRARKSLPRQIAGLRQNLQTMISRGHA